MADFLFTVRAFVRAGNEMTLRQFALLDAVADESPRGRSTRHFAVELRVPKPAITRASQALATLGLIDLKPDPADYRGRVLTLTARGARFIATIEAGGPKS